MKAETLPDGPCIGHLLVARIANAHKPSGWKLFNIGSVQVSQLRPSKPVPH